ncbi:TetR/AcrR family transcriptional regulator C-terminal domain-containing protein [Zhihengliuella alba]|uniref:TetR/AcrR family transcriptional regulator C-terminal domain-containing protein n=1 Tax=Zhihengliuella alba TaxID=547018 RepID=A0ABP7DD73_9MICC
MPSARTAPRRRGRPSEPILSTERITDTAIRIISSRGFGDLTMTALARELGVSASALYNHMPSKREVLIRVQDRINQEIDCSGFERLPWDLALEHWARSYRDCYAELTALIPVVAVLSVADSPHTLRMYETVAQSLSAAGWQGAEVVEVIVAVESLVFGAAYDATAPADIFDAGEHAALAPTFTAAVAARPAEAGAAADAAFDVALSAMLDGLRARLSAARARP